MERFSVVRSRPDSRFQPSGICRGCSPDERRHIESRPHIHTTELRNVVVQGGKVHVHLPAAADEESKRWLEQLGGKLPARHLGATEGALDTRIGVEVHTGEPARCSEWSDVTAIFIRPRILGNICHMMNENVLPLLEVLGGTDNASAVELFTFPGHQSQKPLPHWALITKRLARRTAEASTLFGPSSPRRCLGRLLWGSGRKPFYNSFRVTQFREQVRRLRQLLSVPPQPPAAAAAPTTPRRAIWLQRKRGLHRGLQHLGDVERLLASGGGGSGGGGDGRGWEPRISACCDFSAPVVEQVRAVSSADLIVGLHGAGLANVLFGKVGVLLLEYKGFYGVTDFVYRKMTQLVHGGFVAVRANEDPKTHYITSTQARAGVQCVRALLDHGGDAARVARCASLVGVMQVWPVGHDNDCSFAEWAPKPRPVCPLPSHLDVVAGGCWRWYAHAALTAAAAVPGGGRAGGGGSCPFSFATLEPAARACAAAEWCDGLTRVPPRRAGKCGRYKMRQLPVRPYDGAPTLRVSWVRQNATTCVMPDARP